MKILVTGKTGQVGSRLTQLLPGDGVSVAIGRETMDLASADSIRAVIREARPEVIVNAAGFTDVDRAESEKALVHAVNAVAPGIMAEEAKRLGALLIHYSSVYVFDGAAQGAYTESDIPHPINEYGRSKLAGEQAIAAVGASALILRASWVYDTSGRNFVLTMLRLARERDELRVVDDQVGSPTWALSIAQATAALLRDVRRAREGCGTYNMSALGSVNRYDFTKRMLKLTPRLRDGRAAPRLVRIKTADYPLPARRPLNSMLDTGKLRETFAASLDDWQSQLRKFLDMLHPLEPDTTEKARTR